MDGFSKNFVCAGHDYTTLEKHIPAPLFRKSFTLGAAPQTAKIRIGGPGFYDLFVNGQKITKGFLAPYISNPDDMVYYDDYDIEQLLTAGENVIGVMLGNGMQNCPGGRVWDFDIAAFRGAPRFALTAEIDGKELFDASAFVTHPSPVWFDDLRCGCFYDAQNEQPGWCAPGFDAAAWQPALPAETPRGEAKICTADPILCRGRLKPVSKRRAKFAPYEAHSSMQLDTQYKPQLTEGWLYDFGVNTAGVPELKIKGRAGQRIELQFAEHINADGEVNVQNLSFYPDGYCQRDLFTCSGHDDTFVPPFTYHGARYCLVMGIDDEQATDDLLEFLVLSSDLKQRGSFECSDKTANTLQEFVLRSDLSNFFYFPTDCPHREKNGWTGDAAVSCEQMSLNFATEDSYAEWLRNICRAQAQSGALPGIVPTGGWGFQWGNGPAWDAVLTWLPYYTYVLRGNTSILRECAPSILRYLHYISGRRSADGTVEIGLGDWVPVNRGGGDYPTPLVVTDSIITMSICERAAVVFGALKMKNEQNYARALYEELRGAIRKELVDFGTMTVLGRTQTAQAAALYYGVFEPGEQRAAFDVMMKLIEENDGNFDCGMTGLRVIFHVLSRFGESEKAWQMITGKTFPCYGNIIERGLTAMPESFWADENHIDSLNHHFLGDISGWFITELAGIKINPQLDDPTRVDLKPVFLDSLSFVSAHYDTVAGCVKIEWRREGDKILLDITSPQAVHGSLVLPAGWLFESDNCRIDGVSRQPLSHGKFTARRK